MSSLRPATVSLLLLSGIAGLFPVIGQAAEPAAQTPTITRLEVVPPAVRLDSARRVQQLIVTGYTAAGDPVDLTHTATISSAQAEVAGVHAGIVLPRADGQTTLTITHAGHTVQVPVVVAGQAAPDPVSLQFDVLPALTKQSCNSGACHGSPTGKGGFRLSLRGFDPVLDEETLLREAFGRRVNISDPENSLLLKKPLMLIAHGGGQKLVKQDAAYVALRQWIAEGAKIDPVGTPACVGLEVYPAVRTLRDAARTQQLSVTARFADGSMRDVTALADFLSTSEPVAAVSSRGHVTAASRGETAIVVRFLDQIAISSLTFLQDVPGFVWTAPPADTEVDRLVFERLQRLQILPSELCTDGEFIRRLYLDVLGILPTAAETTAFLDDRAADKRDRLIETVLQRDEYAHFWALKWGDLLQVKGSKMSPAGVHKFHHWLVKSFRDNLPYDQFVRSLVTAEGSTFANPPANYFRTAADTNTGSEVTAQLFLGIRIQCAKCHNHPFERWTQDNYYGLGAFFSRVQRKTGLDGDEQVIWLADQGEVIQPRTKKTLKPILPLYGEVDVPAGVDRRQLLADWLAGPDNPFFARVAVNRIWGHLLGRGIVDPVDDFRDSNPPAHPELLDWLAREFVRSGYDQKQTLRLILRSRTYQLSSRSNASNADDAKYFSHARARLLTAEQLLDAVSDVTGVPEKFAGLPAGIRATQIPSPDVGHDFLKIFGQPARNTACECERSGEPKLSQALQLLSGDFLSQKLQQPSSRLSRLVTDHRARLLAAGEPPATGLQLWLKADSGLEDPSGAPAVDGDRVATWRDQSPHHRDVVAPDAAQQPLAQTTGLSGLPAVRFDGIDDLLHNTQVNLLPAGSPRTVLLVGRAGQAGLGGTAFTFRRSTSGKALFAVQHGVIGNHYYVYSDGRNAAGNCTLPLQTAELLSDPFVSTFLSAGEGQKLAVHLNGAVQTVTQPGGVGADDGQDGFTVGSREDLSGYSWNGLIAEVLVYDHVLSAEDLSRAGSYLTTKYDLATDYPARPLPPSEEVTEKDAGFIQNLYLTALARRPTEDEARAALEYIATSESRRQGFEDLFWAILNSKEFLFQH